MKKRSVIFLVLVVVSVCAVNAQHRFKRNLESVNFVPKGQWLTGVSVNYSQSNMDNYQFLIVEELEGDIYTFKISPTVMYAFKDNMDSGGFPICARF